MAKKAVVKKNLAQTKVVKSTTKARQGVTGHNVRWVLLVSAVAVVVAFGIIYAAFFAAA